MYYESQSSRSPGSHRHPQQTLHRQPSRQFDAYGQLPTGLYGPEDHSARYEAPPRFLPDRSNATLHSGYQTHYDMPAAQGWNAAGFATNQNNTLAAIGATNRMKAPARGRSAIPTAWMDQSQQQPPLPPFGNIGSLSGLGRQQMRPEPLSADTDEELIPTAIVIKNIPFAVKKEQLVGLMTDLQLPLPYAFNYHFDNGVFRGLAFANFTTPEETAVVIDAMNHFELQGRKLRVEYKKMLPLAERERIEREKRERRGQLEEQHRPMAPQQLQTQPSMSSLSSHIPATSPSPVSARTAKLDCDLNDPQVLQFYSQLLLFKEDVSRETLVFPHNLSPTQRRQVHTLAHHMGLAHVSKGNGEQRQVHIFRPQPGSSMSPPVPQMPLSGEPHRRGLNRAATTDFSDVRGSEGLYGTLRGQSSGMLGFPDSPGGGLSVAQNLRAAKSYADLRSYTPSPVPSTASFPATLNTNFGRFADLGLGTAGSSNANLTPTTTMGNREESLLVNGLNGLNLGGGFGQGGSPRALRGMMSWDNGLGPGPIGGHRSFSTAASFEDPSRVGDRNQQGFPSRQPRVPLPERSGFGVRPAASNRNGHANRNSDELSSQSGVEIAVGGVGSD
ncbi:RNA-binding protein Cip2 [Lineolata rhizophorae]|uniref:RNA-binding protein Cip2 n=1 Tax=Lineolata rhizophorae TaxID=578093 RepID=A0A6A6NZL2_9PEZI|nr:RNA-binding protein Cip2 [Lineolata rhizophorae]